MAETAKTETVNKDNKQEVAKVATQTQPMISDYSLGIFGTSDNFNLASKMASALAQSTIVPQQFQKNAPNCLIAISQAQKFGIDPLTVMQNLYVIQGRPSWKSSFLIAMINNSGKFDMELQYEEEEKDGKPYSCKCWTMKDGRKIEGIKVTMDMANAEGWTKKNGSKWLTLPALMLRYRSASFFANFNCPELTSGMYTEHEMYDNDFDDMKKSNKASLSNALKEDESDVIDMTEVVNE